MVRPRLQGKIPITLVCIVLGIMLAVQFRTTAEIGSSVRSQRTEDLVKQLNQTEKERDALLGEIRQLRESAGSDSAQATGFKVRAGLVPLEGPGVIVMMEEPKALSAAAKNLNLYSIRDEDILKILNELRAAGAEALSINGQRLIPSSEIRTAGNALSINNKTTAPPYEIRAIGEPDTLESSLRLRGGAIETLQAWGIQVSVKKQTNVPYSGLQRSLPFRVCQAARKKGLKRLWLISRL